MRQTSIEAYRDIKASGILSKRQKEVYAELFQLGPCTAKELGFKSGIDGAWKRISDLVSYGLVQELGVRKCKVTGKTVLEYDVTDRLAPTERIQKPKGQKQESRKELLRRIEQLETQLHNANLIIARHDELTKKEQLA